MNFLILFPDNKKAVTGNFCSALQYERILESLGNNVELINKYDNQEAEVLIAINADKNNSDIRKFHTDNPKSKIILILSGTDIYPFPSNRAIDSMEISNVLVLLQSQAFNQVPEKYRKKSSVIHQSIERLKLDSQALKSDSEFKVVLISNIRPVKDPLIAPRACQMIPASSKLKITHVGYCLDSKFEDLLFKESKNNDRYEWIGGRSVLETRTILSQSDLLLITSQHEGAGRVVGEAVQLEVPIISTNNDGVMGVLGEEYEGYYPVGDVEALTALLIKAEKDKSFLEHLNLQCKNKKTLFSVEEETKSWSDIINDLFV